MNKLNSKILETVSFNQYNFVDSYDKNIFSNKRSTCMCIDSLFFNIKIRSTNDARLKDYSIMRISSNDRKMKLLVKNRDLSSINRTMSKVEWMRVFMQLQKTTQKQGSKSKAIFAAQNDQILLFEREKNHIKEQHLQVQASLKADELVQEFFVRKWDLDDEMTQCGLNSSEIELIQQNGAGVYDVTSFLQNVAIRLPKETTVIGLNHKTIVHGVAKTIACDEYIDAYLRIYDNDFRAKDDFLEKLTQEKNPIVFVVPHKLFGSKQGITAQEMRWLLENPTQMNNVHFVLGAYKAYKKNGIPVASLKEKQVDNYTEFLTERIFKQLQASLRLPEMEDSSPLALAELNVEKQKFLKSRLQPFERAIKISQLVIEETEIVIEETEKSSGESKGSAPVISSVDLKVIKTYKAIFLMGGAGSGKGTLRELIVSRHEERKYVIIDPDLVKESMPEYQESLRKGDENAATQVHQKSVKIATEQLESSIRVRDNFIYDASGSRSWLYEEQMKAAKSNGMFVELIYVETKLENCLVRTEERGLKTGRVVPKDVVKSTNVFAELNFEDLKPLAHRWKIYNNDGEKLVLKEASRIAV